MGSRKTPGAVQARTDAGRRGDVAALPAAAGALRCHETLAVENAGLAPWCGPTALALATGLAYPAVVELLRRTAPAWYPAQGEIVTAYWRDLLSVLDQHGVAHVPMAVPQPRLNLLRFAASLDAPGWYLLRVTDHFLLLRHHGFGLSLVHDNRHTAEVLTAKTHGRRHVTHATRLQGGALVH